MAIVEWSEMQQLQADHDNWAKLADDLSRELQDARKLIDDIRVALDVKVTGADLVAAALDARINRRPLLRTTRAVRVIK